MARRVTTKVICGPDYPLRDQVRDELRARIVDGRLSPGKRLIEQELADEFSVSRIPVREALRMLQTEGFVDSVPRRGVVVSQLSRDDLESLYDVRSALEVLAFKQAAEHAEVRDIKRLEQLLNRARRATDKGDHKLVSRTNIEFHETVVQIAGNRFLTSALEPLNGRLRWLIEHSDEYERQCADHAALLEAIADHDPDRAAASALAHIRIGRAHALAHYDATRAQAPA
ncbi:GntR family transcriptional regulator [Streptomyces sp. NPDC056309]|uniref:GntR family transcriptional regulator n=1 Tax=unclassified Streptomyces TaxID=2593676 RepID=UPI0035D687F8